MPQTEAATNSALDYAAPSTNPSNLAAWLVSMSLGVTGGYFLSIAGFGWLGVALIFGVLTGTASAIAARLRKIAFGLLGNGVTTVVGITLGVINNLRSGYPNEFGMLIVAGPFIFVCFAVPGLICGALLTWAGRAAA